MSTRSTIAIHENDKIRAIYCHFDGYLHGVGSTLHNHYNTEEKVKELIELGDLSSLSENVKPREGTPHSFDKPQKGVTVAYMRDRGESEVEPNEYSSREELFEAANSCYGAEFVYLFENGEWIYRQVYDEQEEGWQVVAEEL
jgi:hypothetical protein